MVLGATLLALLLAAADGGAAREASRVPSAGSPPNRILRNPRVSQAADDRLPAVEAALACGCPIDAIRAGSQPY